MKYLQCLCGPSKAEIQAMIEEENKQKEKNAREKARITKLAEEEEAYKRYAESPEGKKVIAAIEAAKEERKAEALARGKAYQEAQRIEMEQREANRLAKEASDAACGEKLLTEIETDLEDPTKFMEAYHFDHKLPEGTQYISIPVPVPKEYHGDFEKIREFIIFIHEIIQKKYGKHPVIAGRVDSYYLTETYNQWWLCKELTRFYVTIWIKGSAKK